jgi:hypothetical protein
MERQFLDTGIDTFLCDFFMTAMSQHHDLNFRMRSSEHSVIGAFLAFSPKKPFTPYSKLHEAESTFQLVGNKF